MLYSQLENEKLENYALVTIARDLRLSNLFALEKHHVQEFQPPSSLLVLGHCKFDFQEKLFSQLHLTTTFTTLLPCKSTISRRCGRLMAPQLCHIGGSSPPDAAAEAAPTLGSRASRSSWRLFCVTCFRARVMRRQKGSKTLKCNVSQQAGEKYN